MSFFDIENICFTVAGYAMSYIEFFGTIAGAIYVWLSAKGSIWNWPVGVVNVVFFFFSLFCFGNLGWCFARKAFLVYLKTNLKPFFVTSRSSISRFAPWTVFKSQFCGFAAQKVSTKLQLKICRLARRYIWQEGKSYSFG